MSKNVSEIRMAIEKESFDFFNLNNQIKTKDEVDKKILSINNDYKKERMINTSCLTLCLAMLFFSLWQIINITAIRSEKITANPFDIVFISLSLSAFFVSILYCFYLLSSREKAVTFNFYRNNYYNPVDVNSPRISAGISNMLMECELAVINKEILAQGRSVTLAEHLLMWKMYQESKSFLTKKDSLCNIGLVKRKEITKQEGDML